MSRGIFSRLSFGEPPEGLDHKPASDQQRQRALLRAEHAGFAKAQDAMATARFDNQFTYATVEDYYDGRERFRKTSSTGQDDHALDYRSQPFYRSQTVASP